MGCDCGKPKCDGHCGVSPAVLQINNPSECVLFHKVTVPAAMGTSAENPPKVGAYRNVLLCYEADGEVYLYTSDGIPIKITGTTSNYEILTNKPKINGVELVGDKSLGDIGVVDAITTALADYTKTDSLATVALSGDYNDLLNKPTLPVTHFYLVPAYTVGSPSLIYNDPAHTSQTTYQEFQNAILSGPVQIHQEYDANTYWISNIAYTDIWLDEYISFYLDAEQWRQIYRWDSTDAAPFFQRSQDYYTQVQADWNMTNTSSPAYIKNKPTIPTPTVLNMTYDTTATTWTDTDAGITLRGTQDETFPAILEQIQTFAVPTPVFTNASTGSTLDAEGLYNLLETGADVVLNGVPVGVRLRRINSTTTFTVGGIVCDGVRLTKVGPFHIEDFDPDTSELVYSMDLSSYSATISANAVGTTMPTLLPFAIRVYKRVTFDSEVSPDPQTEYAFEIQGTSYSRTDAPT